MVKLKHIFIVIIAFVFISCERSDECNHSTVAGVNFSYQKNTSSIVTRFYIAPFNNPQDTLFYSVSAGSYIRTLPLSLSEDSTAFLFTATDTIDTSTDVMVFYHQMRLSFWDEPCGFVPEFTLDSIKYTNETIDSVLWLFKDVTTDIESENINITY